MQEEVVYLNLACANLPSEYAEGVRLVVAVREDGDSYTEIGQTETIVQRVSPKFEVGIPIVARLELPQLLKILVYRVDHATERILETFGDAEVDLLQLLTAPGELQLPIRHRYVATEPPLLLVSVSTPDSSSRGSMLQFAGTSLNPHGSLSPAPYLTLELKSSAVGSRQILLYRSEAAHGNVNPRWKEFVIPTRLFPSSCDWSLEVSCYNFNNNRVEDTLLGRFTTTLYQLLSGHSPNKFILRTSSKKKENASVEIVHVQSTQNILSFANRLKSGLQLHFSIAIDFTANNGSTTHNSPDSLHHVHPHSMNPYMKLLKVIVPSLAKFDKLNRVSLLGFGSKTPPHFHQVSHLFALNGDLNSPYAKGVEEALHLYRNNAMEVLPYAPTEYSGVIHHTVKLARAAQRTQSNFYFTLIILTCGALKNAKDTVDTLVDASSLPISVIFLHLPQPADSTKSETNQFDTLFSSTVKSSNNNPLRREVATLLDANGVDCSVDQSSVPQRIFSTISRQADLWSLLN